jgi:hypothetical protein
VREIVDYTLRRDNSQMTARYDDGRVEITSVRQNVLFGLLHVLRHLDPALADSLIAAHEQLAIAARRYPMGMETIKAEAEERRKQFAGQTCTGGFLMAGSSRDFAFLQSLVSASRDEDFEPPLAFALERFQEDTSVENPNGAAKEFWPSTHYYRAILYAAGKRLGEAASALLDRVPDADLRLFAQIELAGALTGLLQSQGSQRFRPTHPPKPLSREERIAYHDQLIGSARSVDPIRSPDGRSVRCPRCEWIPGLNTRWICNCGHTWNTFWTGGRCPACQFQWTVTAWQRCGELSPHDNWYVGRGEA